MKVLMISGDPSIVNPRSEACKRMEEYRKTLGGLDVLLAYGNIFRFIGAVFSGFKKLWHKKYDVITAQDVEHALLAWAFSKFFKVPFQMQIHADIFSHQFVESSVLNKLRVALAKFLIPRADCIRVVSERIKLSLISNFQFLISNITALPIFVDIEKIRNALIKTDLYKKYPGRFIILMASRITKEKNIGLAIEAVGGLITHPLSSLLLIVGNGPELESLKLKVQSEKLERNVKFEPHAPDLVSYYKTCDLFLLTSNYEGYGRTLVEAAAAGAKIVSSDVGIASEILESECVFKVGDKSDLAEKLSSALNLKLPPPKPLVSQTKEDYLRLYKSSFEVCAHKK
ncbi:hypothetical protein A2661_00650 [Candidatus Giovannonibacteria bacterium RIFCSPHIGHO2_01_FULL_45_24]|uniref:Uncharacterized protein n=1 Tax=Candidatus Giovannonibacteria bacterium RIFCSPLOWO2_01_FULL_46_32 TaxID=1798353 RepID=A0A1F5XGY7_9BACT|nr:MAG: hypothetical protein A2661_00650 [Candidatus Giovannonibacteria bacterium RIFCSPHIGHO2_01_FULL_45_24]OGF87086.1 MAG: hypothetical protein A3B19_01490 [Candidatus Giovannonibacteria bacterium RIFCSPLOWO2_01_FULL_46_32]